MQQHALLFPGIIIMQRLKDSHIGIQLVLQEGLIDFAVEILGKINGVVHLDVGKLGRECLE